MIDRNEETPDSNGDAQLLPDFTGEACFQGFAFLPFASGKLPLPGIACRTQGTLQQQALAALVPDDNFDRQGK